MQQGVIIGNVFSLFSAICIMVSASQKNKKDFMLYQVGDTLFGSFACIMLSAYAALVISIICLIRNILSYKNKLTQNYTMILTILGIITGLCVNNLGMVGLLPIIASASFTICIYITKNEQQMRYALVVNMLLWFVHNAYVQAYPSAVACIVICFWTLYQIKQYKKKAVVIF